MNVQRSLGATPLRTPVVLLRNVRSSKWANMLRLLFLSVDLLPPYVARTATFLFIMSSLSCSVWTLFVELFR